MQITNMNESMLLEVKTIGRKKRKKLNNKIKRQEKLNSFMNFCKKNILVILLFIIVALSTYLIIMQTKESNLIKNLYRDPLIPNSMVERVIKHLN